jgi:hypothetical protein
LAYYPNRHFDHLIVNMDHVSSDHARAKRLSSLASAAEFLAKAAVTLSEAARAAAEAFSEEISVSSPQFKGSSGLPSGVYPIVSYESDPELSPSVERPRDSHEATNGTGQTIIEGEFEDEECTNPEDSDYYISGKLVLSVNRPGSSYDLRPQMTTIMRTFSQQNKQKEMLGVMASSVRALLDQYLSNSFDLTRIALRHPFLSSLRSQSNPIKLTG